MCCGGEMVVHLEVLEAQPRLVIFGAGHVARPLAKLAVECGFAVTVVDARAEWLSGERFPSSVRTIRDPEAFAREWQATATDFAVVTTHDHGLDQKVVQALLPKALRYTGLIGSLAKQRKFALRLRARGASDADIARLRTPVGLAIGARTPEEIAVSIVAELVSVRRGGSPERGWVPPARVTTRTGSEEASVSPPAAQASGPGAGVAGPIISSRKGGTT
jgi:xanthine dehydrogenase accessory factor